MSEEKADTGKVVDFTADLKPKKHNLKDKLIKKRQMKYLSKTVTGLSGGREGVRLGQRSRCGVRLGRGRGAR